jgi:hypothetical protein
MGGTRGHFAIYGQVRMQRMYCQDCRVFALVVDGKLKCCNARVEALDETAKHKRMSDVALRRTGPTARYRKEQLERQQYRCFYCSRLFGSYVYRHSHSLTLRLAWDHIDPWVYSLDNQNQNFVAACHVCNGIKAALMFRSFDEARYEIAIRWKAKGYSDMCTLSVEIYRQTPLAKIL